MASRTKEVEPKILDGREIRLFPTRKAFHAWLDASHGSSPGLWLRIAKKGSGVDSVSYLEALDVALCYGWIDGQKKSYDEATYLQKFTPRLSKSIWSKVNTAKAERLIESGEMMPSGLAAIDAAKADGRWAAAYDAASTATVPEDLQQALDRSPEAAAFFETLDRQNRYAILFRIQTARKEETREKRIRQFVEMLERHEKIYGDARA